MRNASGVLGIVVVAAAAAAWGGWAAPADASLLVNGNLDQTHAVEIFPGFFGPQPASWQHVGTRANTGAYLDGISSEPWAGPAPTPVTAGGVGSSDWGVFFKPFTGNTSDGPATVHLYQDVAATAGTTYTLTGWAGAEANALMADARFAIDFLDADGNLLPAGEELSLLPALYVNNDQAFDYKQYTLDATAPAGAAFVRARVSMLGATANPIGGGQAFVVDDLALTASIPEPATAALALTALTATASLRRRRRRRHR